MSKPKIAAVFVRTPGGKLGAVVDDHSFLALPAGDRYRIVGTWRSAEATDSWEPSDFYISEGFTDGEDAFRAFVEDYAEHRRQLLDLSRHRFTLAIETPWGRSQDGSVYGPGVIFYSTPSHGGFKLTEPCNAQVPAALRHPEGWYEEDAD